MNEEDDDGNDGNENEHLRVSLTGLKYPFNTDKNLAIKKQMLEIEVLDKLSNKLDDFDDFDELEDDDE